jgi:hypothetical protein
MAASIWALNVARLASYWAMTACRCASPRVADVALASAAVIRALPAARWVLRAAQPADSGTVEVVDVLLVVDDDVLELVDDEVDDELVDDELELDDELEDDDDDEEDDDEDEEDDDEVEDDEELEDEDDDDEVVPAAKVIDRWAKKLDGWGCSTRRVQSLLVAQFSGKPSSETNVLVTVTAALEKLPLPPTGTPPGVRALQRSTPLSTRHSLMNTGNPGANPEPLTLRLAEVGRFVGAGLTVSETLGESAQAMPTPTRIPTTVAANTALRVRADRCSSDVVVVLVLRSVTARSPVGDWGGAYPPVVPSTGIGRPVMPRTSPAGPATRRPRPPRARTRPDRCRRSTG